jgi:hypothetical protein
VAWVGPNGYQGKFYGNGYTIELKYTGTITGAADVNLGLFNSLASTAELRDFTLLVVPSDPPITITTKVRFGGVVGNALAGANATISNVTVTGTLAIGAITTTGQWLYIGGMIGELNPGAAGGVITIENCVSSLNISAGALGSLTQETAGGIRIGGFIGRQYRGTINLRDSYSSGAITVGYGGSSALSVGGLIGYLDAAASTNIEHCYSVSPITSTHSAAGVHQVGGLIGVMMGANNKLNTSAALNPPIVATGGTQSLGRAVGSPGSGVISNVYALSAAGDGAANGAQGLAKTEGVLRTATTWTSDLGFNSTRNVWDFSSLTSGWPVRKN